MPMRDQPDGVRRVRRDDARPPRGYDIFVDGELAGWMERLEHGAWRVHRDGAWPQKFDARSGAYLAAVERLAESHRAAKRTAELVTAAESAGAQPVPLSAVASDPFSGDPFADPLA